MRPAASECPGVDYDIHNLRRRLVHTAESFGVTLVQDQRGAHAGAKVNSAILYCGTKAMHWVQALQETASAPTLLTKFDKV